ncbi:hypothetical protein CAL7716_095770 [Calothrix sp. PCC 7716]|nr:hypothetical protein CAL7716_095770 [Calothrix sp. PCC 7716]
MIISFNPIIFQTQDSEIQSILAKILLVLMETNIHFIDIKSINAIFYDENFKYIFDSNVISRTHFSLQQQKTFKEFLNKKSQVTITNLYKQHLKHIVIGSNGDKKEIEPKHAYKIITERSKVIVENGINDWKFIKGICQKYSSGTKRRSIYELLNRAIKDELIESENCGGVGEITKVTQRWINSNRYQNIYQYKLIAIFDSDKQDSNKFITPHKSKIEYFKVKTISTVQPIDYEHEPTDLILWHILYKRKIENYVPLNVLFKNVTLITPQQQTELENKTNDELDYIEYNQDNIGISEPRIKEQFPEMFLSDFSYRDFEKRCEHHKVFLLETNELVSEMEQILLKIAKII